jgi:general secretion pathway protein A
MYQNFYGLRELPFELTPNPKYLFLPPQHREALSALEYGLSSAKPITVLIGEAGTGKTTLIHAALESERCRGVRCVYVNNPLLTRKEFVETLSHRFGLSAQAAGSKAVLLDELGRVLQEGRDRGQITALVIDEAQGMSATLLEEIRLLANQETATRRLLPVVLAGQPELAYRLNETGLRQLKQRVTLRCEVTPLDLRQTAAYIGHRVRVAGGDAGRLFTREAVMLIHERSGGIPRTISVICDNALLTGFALGRQPIDAAIIREVALDFDLAAPLTDHTAFEHYAPETIPAPTDTAPSEAGDLPEQNAEFVEADLEPAEIVEPPVAPITTEHDRELFFAFKGRPRFSLFGRRS